MNDSRKQDVLELDFVIVGGGLAGLATAHALASSKHRVRVFDASSGTSNSAASGFRVTPNGCKVLEQWGVWEEFTVRAFKVASTEFIDLETGERIGYLGWPEEVLRELGGGWYTISHRDLHELLRNLALKSGVEIITGATVVAVHPPTSDTGDASCSESGCDPNKPSITLATGDVHQAGIVIGADGHRSLVRQAIERVPDTPTTSGKVLYTGTIPFETMQGDEQLREVLEMRHPLWLGNKHYAMCSCNDDFWLCTFWQVEELGDGDSAGWGTSVPANCLKYGDKLDPRLRSVIEHLSSLERVKTDILPHADSWIDESESIIITGEAAHPFPPGSFPGAPIILEEASFLGTLFSHLRHPSQISLFLHAYEQIRKPRASRLLELELDNLTILQLPPGPERKARDHTWAEQKKADIERNVGYVRSTSSASEEDMISEEQNMELRRQWQAFYENWGCDGRDAAESWWIEWGLLGERAMELQKEADDQHRISITMTGIEYYNSALNHFQFI
ncbi:FAD/NAD-P-binding domain-containing protein [Stereum hirsutum FP-91666 SS1]|uniref:FAD/NAD-P-binding domain-containing protein n=1 Tax=Stereum hirsutum (strain FP-91666) TaxID=721885 RepID=UPI0004449E29|nr:FAD/NAD-P-binding domain-containing protein [Stereum hirsutum FP-91666 SS1]EIM82669.1 FAD/NAD-P-binding domain-containing protein [Stereum hirsutum FP-91666 SS1]